MGGDGLLIMNSHIDTEDEGVSYVTVGRFQSLPPLHFLCAF